MQSEIYFDNSATTKPFLEVVEVIGNELKNTYGNPSALHKIGIDAEKVLKKSRQDIANTLNVRPQEIIFTSGGTESNNFAIMGYLERNRGNHIITTKIEHPSVLKVFEHLETKGYRVDYINVLENGKIDLDDLSNKITKETCLISVMYVNNETGAVQPIKEVINIKNSKNSSIKVHVDAVQAYGKFTIDLSKLMVDMMSISAHKIHGPKGVGCLFIRDGVKLSPIMIGGGQEDNLRSGTENVPLIAGFAKAASMIHENINENYDKVCDLRRGFLNELAKTNIEYEVVSDEDSLPYILNVAFLNTKSEVMLHHLEQKSVYVSTGSACSQRRKKYSHVLKAMGKRDVVIDGAIRFSFSSMNTKDEVLEVIRYIEEIIPRIYIKGGRKK